MSIEKLNTITTNRIRPLDPSGVEGKNRVKDFKDQESFVDALKKFNEKDSIAVPNNSLDSVKDSIRFSNHAIERMQSRGITFSPEQLSRIDEALEKANGKGSNNSLVLLDDSALIVSVKNKTVVTVMDQSMLKENVFTNIDSTVVM